MLHSIIDILTERADFFGNLLLEHIGISVAAIVIAILLGGIAGILISEFQRSAKLTLGVVNLRY